MPIRVRASQTNWDVRKVGRRRDKYPEVTILRFIESESMIDWSINRQKIGYRRFLDMALSDFDDDLDLTRSDDILREAFLLRVDISEGLTLKQKLNFLTRTEHKLIRTSDILIAWRSLHDFLFVPVLLFIWCVNHLDFMPSTHKHMRLRILNVYFVSLLLLGMVLHWHFDEGNVTRYHRNNLCIFQLIIQDLLHHELLLGFSNHINLLQLLVLLPIRLVRILKSLCLRLVISVIKELQFLEPIDSELFLKLGILLHTIQLIFVQLRENGIVGLSNSVPLRVILDSMLTGDLCSSLHQVVVIHRLGCHDLLPLSGLIMLVF